MILNSDCMLPGERTDTSFSIVREVYETCVRLNLDGACSFDLAQSISLYCDHHVGSAVVPSDYLTLLIARALAGSGFAKEANVLLATDCGEDAARSCISLMGQPESVTGMWRMCREGVARRGDWTCRAQYILWILDLSSITCREEDAIELAMYAAIKSLVKNIVHVYDATSGRGVLGIRGLQQWSGKIAGDTDSGGERSMILMREMIRYCNSVLEQTRQGRSWQEVPEVVHIDL